MKSSIAMIFVFLGLTMAFTGCKKDDNSSQSVTQNLQTGQTWKVSYYYDTDKDETYKFSSYTFEFKDDGTLVATGSSGTTNGTWNVGSRFNISSFSVSPLDDLNDDWVIVSQSDNVIKLKDDNSSKVEELHFSLL